MNDLRLMPPFSGNTMNMEQHPILGNSVLYNQSEVGKVYTRTVVLWAYGITMDPQKLWEHVEVRSRPDGPVITKEEDIKPLDQKAAPVRCSRPGSGRRRATRASAKGHRGIVPVVRMLTTATKRRGWLSKRMRSQQSFRSVLSMDVEYNGFMPNLKISGRNTLQVTGAQDLQALGQILRYLVTTYNGRGFNVNVNTPSGFVGDVVLANVHFKMSFRLDRAKLRDRVNAERSSFIASYEPLVRDVSVSLKYMNHDPLPNNGSVYPRWDFHGGDQWGTVTVAEARQLVPHINLKTCVQGCLHGKLEDWVAFSIRKHICFDDDVSNYSLLPPCSSKQP